MEIFESLNNDHIKFILLDNGIGLTPPMGWMTWERFRCQLDCENRTDCLDENVSESENVA